MKPGWQTSEFWMALGAELATNFSPVAQAAGPKTQLAVTGAVAMSYILARAFTKTKAK